MEFKIKEARTIANISQKELAEYIGVTAATLSGYENGKHDPRSDFLAKIAEACNCTVDFLLGRESVKEQTPTSEEPEAGDKVSIEETNAFLVSLGCIKPGEDLSDRDLQFLSSIIKLLNTWFAERS